MLTPADMKKLEKKFATKEDLKKLEEKFNHRFDVLSADFDTREDRIYASIRSLGDRILSRMDSYMKKTEDYKIEHDILAHQVNRHDRWIRDIANKTTTPLIED